MYSIIISLPARTLPSGRLPERPDDNDVSGRAHFESWSFARLEADDFAQTNVSSYPNNSVDPRF
jgi:hypothetical protein